MALTKNCLIATLACAMLALPHFAEAAKGGGTGGGSGTTIRIEDLGRPAGSLTSSASAINDAGTLVVGFAYWDATLESPNNYYAARWTRSAASGAWQAEDLRPLLPSHKTSHGTLVNNAGTVVISTEYMDSTAHWFVIRSSGETLELAPGEAVSDLDESDRMLGGRADPGRALPDRPLYWPSLSDPPVELPLLEPGFGGHARWFHGPDILGTLSDANGNWLVRWSPAGDSWTVARVQQLPSSHGLVGVSLGSPGGRLALMHCAGKLYFAGTAYACDWRAESWDPPYTGMPTYLPNVAGPYSWPKGVMDDGAVLGITVASNGVDMLPVVWPTPTTLVKLPLLSGGKGGSIGGFNAYRQIAGAVDVPVKGRSRDHAVVWTLP